MSTSVFSRYRGLGTIEARGEVTLPIRASKQLRGADSILHVVTSGESLDQLALRYYGNEELWWRIADANPARLPLDLSPGETIVIPPLTLVTRT